MYIRIHTNSRDAHVGALLPKGFAEIIALAKSYVPIRPKKPKQRKPPPPKKTEKAKRHSMEETSFF
jgi:hypothetical protein